MATPTERLVAAFGLAAELHAAQTRKGSDIPYVTHLMAVAGLVGEYDGTEDDMIAALLHDAVEDQGGLDTLEHIRKLFGDGVADCVEACSDAFEMPKPPWQERKERFIAAVHTVPHGVKLIVAADKLHNMRTLIRDLRMHGPGVWQRFATGEEGTLWYHREMVAALDAAWEHPILIELRDALHELEETAAGLPQRDRTQEG